MCIDIVLGSYVYTVVIDSCCIFDVNMLPYMVTIRMEDARNYILGRHTLVHNNLSFKFVLLTLVLWL